ncbi:serine protease [Haloferula sp. BvORR071]|uniref:S1 family peptidase n=1 Tax=Haloferula sp. BvORR071 TaxID=1396141 RepID=UPI000556CFE4|nr:serine protease [Haloferula sp. BvORR071]
MKISSSSIIFGIFLLSLPAGAREPANLDEAKKCVVFVKSYDEANKPFANATGFIMESDGTQWIYTNAHAIDGGKRIEFTDSEGQVIKGLGRFACFSKSSGSGSLSSGKGKQKETHRFGGDGIRVELTTKRDLAFAPASDPASFAKGAEVITLGDNDGDKALEVLDGTITNSNGKVLQSTCKTRPGCSGAPLFSKADYKVIALHTWGFSTQTKLASRIWQDEKTKTAGASILAKAEWIEMKAADFLRSSTEAMKFRDTVKGLYLVYLLVPQEDGFKIDPATKVYATSLTFEEAFKRFDEDGVLRPVIHLNRQLAGRGRDIGVNNMELVKIYSRALQEIRRSYLTQRKGLEGKLAPYYLTEFEQSGFYEAGDWLAKELDKPETWFEEKAKLGGSMPVGRWFNLRPLSDLGE